MSEPNSPDLFFYPNASLARVRRATISRSCALCGKEFVVEEFKSKFVTLCYECRGLVNHGPRSAITKFSRSSRRRLMHILNTVKRDILPLFVTLTYPDEFYLHHLDGELWKRDLRRFEWRFRRKFPKGCFIWRLEVVDRKSGEYKGEFFPHFHLLVFNVGCDDMRAFVAKHWPKIAANGSEDCVKVHSHPSVVTVVRTRRGIMSYASKGIGSTMSGELAKEVQAHGGKVGRWWGIAARSIFQVFVDVAKSLRLTEDQAVQLMRYFRKLARIHARQWRSLTVFIDGVWLEANLSKIMSPP